MLVVETYVAPSTIPNAGNGCFARNLIKKGDLIWEFNAFVDRIYTDKNLVLLDQMDKKFVETYSYRNNGLYFLCVDNARFVNHSTDSFNTFETPTLNRTYAFVDILPGEEILSNYGNLGVSDADKDFNLSL